MRKNFLLLVFLFACSFSAFGQSYLDDTLLRVDSDGKGSWNTKIRFDRNGDTVYVLDAKNCLERIYSDYSSVDNDVIDFHKRCSIRRRYWYSNFVLISIGDYKGETLDGYYKEMYNDGISEGQMRDGKKSGWWKYTNPRTGETSRRYFIGNDWRDEGFSLGYQIVPGIILLLLVIGGGIFLIKKGRYDVFYFSLCFILLVCILILISSVSSSISRSSYSGGSENNEDFQRFNGWVTLASMVILPLLSIFNFFLPKKLALKIVSGFMILGCLVLWLLYYFISHIGKMGG
jgi:hypothetical protein